MKKAVNGAVLKHSDEGGALLCPETFCKCQNQSSNKSMRIGNRLLAYPPFAFTLEQCFLKVASQVAIRCHTSTFQSQTLGLVGRWLKLENTVHISGERELIAYYSGFIFNNTLRPVVNWDNMTVEQV